MRSVLAPIDEDFSGADSFVHRRNNHIRMLLFQRLSDGFGESLRLIVTVRRIQWGIEVQTFVPGKLDQGLDFQAFQNVLQPQRDLSAVENASWLTRIQIEEQRRRLFCSGRFGEQRVHLNVVLVGRPDQ